MSLPTTVENHTADQQQIYPDALYFASRVSEGGAQPVYKKLLPDGGPTQLSPVPSQKLHNHSPDGFQWGYGGSGPAQLSLALLLDATTDPDTALAFYQEFKREKVAGWGERWSITRSEILLWIAEQQKEKLEALAKANQN